MKKIIIALVAIAAVFTMVSCSKDQPDPTEGNEVAAFTENILTKTSLSGNDTDGYEVVWSEGDTFKLGSNTFTLMKGTGTTNGTFQGDVPGINGWKTAYYPVSYDGSNWPTEQTYTEGNITGSPMKAEVYCFMGEISGGKVEFKNEGGILRLNIKGTGRLKSIKLAADGLEEITLNCGEGVDLDNTDGTVFHIAMPEGAYTGTCILFIASDNRHCVKFLNSDKPLVINRSKITSESIKIDKWSNNSPAPDGALSGTFTVSAEGKKVFFSKGNLYWDDSNYKFEYNQYDCNVSDHQSSFFWSNKAEYARGSEWILDYNAPIAFFTNADEVTANPGFTANGQTGLWRTLSKDEWNYLIQRDKGIGEATINGVKGVIIFHDEYDGKTDGLTSIPEGCVFLPASDRGEGIMGFYWSSTPKLESPYYPCASGLRYEDGVWPPSVVLDGMLEKNSVRLVTDVPESPNPTFNVTFDANGHGVAPAQYTEVQYHTKITKPADPVVDGYTHWGWYKDKACTAEWDFDSDIVTSNITLYANWKIDGALPGTFTVNSNGKKVCFAKGNLWYGLIILGSDSSTFNFEENQYDLGVRWNENHTTAYRDDEHVSHFLWSKNADVARAFKYNDSSASESDAFFTNSTQTTPNPYFTANKQKGLWRTLSSEEWTYLVNNNGSTGATINDVWGIIIFCDEYSGKKEGEFTQIPKGCLFLPAVGFRNEGEGPLHDVGDIGFYGTASPRNKSYDALHLYFERDKVLPNFNDARHRGQSVRLVTEVK